MLRKTTRILLLSALPIMSAFSAEQKADDSFGAKELNRELVMASLWVEVSGEYKALAYQAFNLAKVSLEQFKDQNPSIDKFAVVVDVDETVLNNVNYEAWLIKEGVLHSSARQKMWADEAIAPAIPGSVEFLNFAASLGAEVFYVTNRREDTRAGTLENLKKEGFPFTDDQHLLMKSETSNKQIRRDLISANYHIALLIGDNLRDFSDDFNTETLAETEVIVNANKSKFGTQFILLPNPQYGDWEGKIYQGNWRLSPGEKSELRHKNLRPWQPSELK